MFEERAERPRCIKRIRPKPGCLDANRIAERKRVRAGISQCSSTGACRVQASRAVKREVDAVAEDGLGLRRRAGRGEIELDTQVVRIRSEFAVGDIAVRVGYR